MDGLAVCRRIRATSDAPIIIVSAKSEETDVVVGLELGADDYLVKPFRLNELLARIRAQLRRQPSARVQDETPAERLRAGRVELDTGSHEVRVDGKLVALTPVEFRLLMAMMRSAGQVLSREKLLATIWGYDGYDLSLVNTHINRLRGKIEENPHDPQVVRTVRGFGYRLQA
jgi:two-component system, OmpR family, response regulator MtrA